ncbi:hypothetical protein HF325_003582 [Metschnikowia pulcherrima]|uniref:RRM domain-containing protein n=1 Tax=Metschnikowia pulcherrima TaxID=27326 RepID=A0A8H7GU30_9ASCO|nr:hypothetical protein HF325_003582 [Metschnikowia pulcherrima]
MMRTSGGVARADVIENRWGRSRGFGTVVFDTPEDAQAAIERFNGEVLEGRQLEVRLSKDISERRRPELRNTEFTEGVTGDGPPSSVIYADNLPFITTEADLHELFETIGRVTRAEIQYNDRGRPNGTAVVEFELSSLADVAITNLNGYNYGGRDLRISYARRPENYDAPMDAEPEQYSAELEQYQGEPQQFSAEPEQFTAEPVQQYQGEPAVTGDAIDEDIQDAPQQT